MRYPRWWAIVPGRHHEENNMRKTAQNLKIPVRFLGFTLCFLICLVSPNQLFAASVVVDPSVSDSVVLNVGDSLYLAWAAAPPDKDWEAVLSDASGGTLAQFELTSATDGGIAQTLLWPFSGAAGCGGFQQLVLAAIFDGLDEAAEVLVGQSFNLEIYAKGAGVPSGSVTFTFQLPAELFFLSDEEGCLRSCFPSDQPVYLSRWRGTALPIPVRFFLVDADKFDAGLTFDDVREQYEVIPQKFIRHEPNLENVDILGPIAFQEDLPGGTTFLGVVRPISGSENYIWEAGDTFAAQGNFLTHSPILSGGNSGVVVEPWDPCTKGPGSGS